MKSAFRKISRVGNLRGGTKWYLSPDCLISAKRTMYVVEYRRFYLHDLESIMVWPSRSWLWRLIVPALLLGTLGISFWQWINAATGAVFATLALGWVALELARGPTARSRIRTTGASVDLPLVKRTRGAGKVLAKIDAAVRDTRGAIEQPAAPGAIASPAERLVQTRSEAAATESVAAATQTNGF
ncbi:MAG TPA: hypothetical protein VL156_06815 [Terriglobales bacterium]|nr:hypothetical protein [Terriglobales bacterium]